MFASDLRYRQVNLQETYYRERIHFLRKCGAVLLLSGLLFFRIADAQSPRDISTHINSANELLSSKPVEAADHLEKALALSFEFKNLRGRAYTYHSLGALNYQLEKYDQAIDYYEKARALFEPMQEGLYNLYRNLGMAYHAADRYAKSLEAYQLFLPMARAKGDSAAAQATEAIIARLHGKTGQHQEAISQLNTLYNRQQVIQDEQAQVNTANSIANQYLQTGDTVKALGYLNANSGYVKPQNQATNLSNIAQVYGYQKDYSQQIAYERKANFFNRKSQNPQAVNSSNLRVADLLIQQDSATKAIPFLEESLVLIEKIEKAGDPIEVEQKKQAYEQLSRAYEASGQIEQALETYQNYALIADSARQQRARAELARLRLEQNVLEKESRIQRLEAERQINSARIVSLEEDSALKDEGLERQRMINYSLFGGISLLLLSTFLILRSARQKRRAHQLLALRSLRSQMNPHFIFNSLNSVNSFIARNDERSANRYLSEFSRLMRAVMDNSRHDFISLASEVDILRRYLKLEHLRFSEKFDYKFEVDPEIDSESLLVPSMLVQPYIENAVWHGLRYKDEKGLLKVHIRREGNRLLALIEDNGIGREKSRELKTKNQLKQSSTGMKTTSERIQLLNQLHKMKLAVHILDLQDEDGNATGTRVEIEIPMQNNTGNEAD